MSLRHLAVRKQEPSTEDWLSKDIKHSIGDNLLVDAEDSGAIGHTPDDWVDEPDDDGVRGDGAVELAQVGALLAGLRTAVEDEVPDDHEEGNAGDGVPAPALWVALGAVGSEETGQDHDDVGGDGHHDVAAAGACQEEEVQEQEWRGDGPVNVAGVVHLPVDVLVCVRDVLVVLCVVDVVVVDAVAGAGMLY